MSPSISIVAHLGSDTSDLTRLVGSVDAQSLPYAGFEVIFALDGVKRSVDRRIAELEARRPNVRALQIGAGDSIAKTVADAASGNWLLYLTPGVLAAGAYLQPKALEQLVGFVATHDADLVVVRADVAGHVNDLFAPGSSSPADGALPDPFVALYQAEFLARQGSVLTAESAHVLSDAPDRFAVFGGYPCVVVPGRKVAASRRALTFDKCQAEWVERSLQVNVRGRTSGDGELRLAIVHSNGEQHWLPGQTSVSAQTPFDVTTSVDLFTAAAGASLAAGVWQVVAGVHGTGTEWTAQQPVPVTGVRRAVVDGTLVAPASKPAVGLDIGATTRSALPKLSGSDVVITETAAGVSMTAALPGMYVYGDSVTEGAVLLGDFRLRARLIAQDGAARLACMLSGLHGRSTISTQFGSARPAATGLDLEISPVGLMSVVPATAPARTGRQHAPKPTSGGPLARRLRASVPARLDPAVRALARNRTARKVYDRLVGSGKRG